MATRKPPSTQGTYRKPSGPAPKGGAVLTSERISSDLEAFRKAGGRIEVLGTTRVLTKVEQAQKKDGAGS
ncbi:MAG TPA: hypothetical protein VFF91_01225 [Pseudoxanthomonas sp.]|nr:hypothetical protein [Pseudoxanthomonas sp.]